MSNRPWIRGFLALFVGLFSLLVQPSVSHALQFLVADRLSDAVYRYDENGVYRGVVVSDPYLVDDPELGGPNDFLGQPSGIVLSPDQSKLYVSNLNGRVVQYDYSTATGKATNPSIFADDNDGLSFPNSMLFSQDGSKLYVSNLGGTGVAQFNPDGSSAGMPVHGSIGGGAFFQFAGLAYAPTGELLVAAFQDFTGVPNAGTTGAVAKSDPSISFLTDFIPADPVINGASGLLVNGNHLYVTGMHPAGPTGNIARYDLTTGAADPGLLVDNLLYPQQLIADPNGNGFLLGVLGETGQGLIAHYDFEGNLVGDGVFAYNQSVAGFGFSEATAFAVAIPEPAGAVLASIALFGVTIRRRFEG